MADLCTVANVKQRLDITDSTDDAMLNTIVAAVSVALPDHTGRRFYATTETRYYQATSPWQLDVDDLLTITTLKTDDDANRVYETTWATSDYDLEPDNAALNSRPYDCIRVSPLGRYFFPTWRRGVQIAGSFGYAATAPGPIVEAALLASEQVYKRKDAILGTTGSAGFQQVVKNQLENDPEIAPILRMYRRLT